MAQKSKKSVNKWVMIAAIGGITAVEICALLQEIDGALLTISVAAMAGIAGWSAPQLKLKN